jgi:SAM-dependent methyltransferase
MIRDEHYRAKQRHRGRGVADLERAVGGVCGDIDARLARQDVVRILELGCGYGTALLELRARYGAHVELHGVNRAPHDGNREILLRNAADRGLAVDDAAPERLLPAITHADVASGLPFANDAFDLVVSQVAWMYFGNKVRVLREVMRVLRADGLARIDADEIAPRLPAEYARLVEIWRDGRLVPFADYLARFGLGFAAAPEGTYLRIEKRGAFGDDLALRFEIDTSRIHSHWDGIKCVYACGAPAGSTDSTTPAATSASIARSS